jgi:hypothetical protein
VWIPQTPAGTDCDWLMSDTEAEAWKKLLKDAAHMPYRGIEGFKQRGYTVNEWTATEQPKRKTNMADTPSALPQGAVALAEEWRPTIQAALEVAEDAIATRSRDVDDWLDDVETIAMFLRSALASAPPVPPLDAASDALGASASPTALCAPALRASAPIAGARGPTDFALEFAEYMAQRAEDFIDAVNADGMLRMKADEEGLGDDADDQLADARQTLSEYQRGLCSGIYEFRKRRDRARDQVRSTETAGLGPKGDEPGPKDAPSKDHAPPAVPAGEQEPLTDKRIDEALSLPVACGETVRWYIEQAFPNDSQEVRDIMVREIARTILATPVPSPVMAGLTDFQLERLFDAVHEHGHFGREFRQHARAILSGDRAGTE